MVAAWAREAWQERDAAYSWKSGRLEKENKGGDDKQTSSMRNRWHFVFESGDGDMTNTLHRNWRLGDTVAAHRVVVGDMQADA